MEKKGTVENTVIVVSLVLIFIFSFTTLYMMLLMLPRYVERYFDLGITLPLLTKIFIQKVMLIRSLPLMLPMLVAGFFVGILVINLMQNKRLVAKIYAYTSIFLILSALLSSFALELPFLR